MIRVTLEASLAGHGGAFSEKHPATRDNVAYLIRCSAATEMAAALREDVKLTGLRKRRKTRKVRQEILATQRMISFHRSNASLLDELTRNMKVEIVPELVPAEG